MNAHDWCPVQIDSDAAAAFDEAKLLKRGLPSPKALIFSFVGQYRFVYAPSKAAARRAGPSRTKGEFHVDGFGAHRAPSVRRLPQTPAADGRARLHVRRDGRRC